MKKTKQEVIEKINETYSPNPDKIEVWFEEDYKLYYSIVRQVLEKKDHQEIFIYLSVWDPEDLTCLSETEITEKTWSNLYKFTAIHELYNAARRD